MAFKWRAQTWWLLRWYWNVAAEPWKTPGFLPSKEEISLGREMRLNLSELLCNKVLLKSKREKASDRDIRTGRKTSPLIVFSWMLYSYSVQFSHWVVFDSLWSHEPQHATPPYPSPTPRVHSDSRPLSQWRHPAISSSVVPFFSCPQSLPASVFQWVNSSHEVAKVLEFQL